MISYRTGMAGFFALLLAACNGIGGAGFDPVEIVPVYADADGVIRDAGEVLADGGSLTAGGTAISVIALDYGADTAARGTGGLLLRRNSAGELSVRLDGETQDFTVTNRRINPEDDRVEGYVERDDTKGLYVGLYSHTGPITDLLADGSDYAEAVSLFTSEVGRVTQQRFLYAIVGTQTQPDVIGATAIGTYRGTFEIEALPTDYQSFSDQRVRFRGTADLTATADGDLSGALTNIFVLQPEAQDYVGLRGSIAMQTAQITETGYAGPLTADSDFAESFLAPGLTRIGSYGGTFYGPASEQSAGTITIATTSKTDDMVGAGFFSALQNR